jgi:hypothetical protein
MNVLVVAAALAVMLAAGWGLCTIVVRPVRVFALTERLALSWLLGSGAISLLIWMGGFFLKGAALPVCIFIVALGLGLAGWRRGERLSGAHFNTVEICLCFIVAAEVVVIVQQSFVHTLGWDGLLNWEIKARYAWLNGGVLPASFLQDQGRRFAHQEYPLCLPFAELWLYFWLGAPNQYWAKTIFDIFYLAAALLLANFVSSLTGRRWVGLIAPCLLFFIPQVVVGGGSAVVGYVDFPLSVFYLAAIGFLVRAADDNDISSFRAFAACAALLPWVKQEGAVLWAVAAVAGSIVILRTQRSRRDFFLLAPGLVIIIAWRSYLHFMHVTSSTDFLPLSIVTVWNHLYRVEPITRAVFVELFDVSKWSFLWVAVGVGCCFLLRRVRELRSVILLLGLLAPAIIYFSTYILSNWPDYLGHMRASVSRLLLQLAPLGLTIAALEAARMPATARRTAPGCAARNCERTGAVEFA